MTTKKNRQILRQHLLAQLESFDEYTESVSDGVDLAYLRALSTITGHEIDDLTVDDALTVFPEITIDTETDNPFEFLPDSDRMFVLCGGKPSTVTLIRNRIFWCDSIAGWDYWALDLETNFYGRTRSRRADRLEKLKELYQHVATGGFDDFELRTSDSVLELQFTGWVTQWVTEKQAEIAARELALEPDEAGDTAGKKDKKDKSKAKRAKAKKAARQRTGSESAAELVELRAKVASLDIDSSLREYLDAHRLLGEAELDAGTTSRAIAEFELLVTLESAVFGPTDPQTMVVRGFLGRALMEAGHCHRAEAVLRSLLTDRTEVLGAAHELTLVTRGNLLRAIGRGGRPDEALLMAEQLLTDRLELLGPDHSDTFNARSHVAQLMSSVGLGEEAVTALEQLYDDRVRVLGPDHPDTRTNRHSLEVIRNRHDLGTTEQLLDYVDQAIARNGADHPLAMSARFSAATAFYCDSRYKKAETMLIELVADRCRVLGDDDPDTLSAKALLVEVRTAMYGPCAQVDALADLAGTISRVLGPTAVPALDARLQFAHALLLDGQGELVEAETRSLAADIDRTLTPWHPLRTEFTNLIDTWRHLYEAQEAGADDDGEEDDE
jgi:hypothetical protein